MAECNGCTLCCKLLDVHWMDSPSNVWCKHCDIGSGCKIFADAPDDCLNYQCVYNELDGLTIELRPDRCKIIFEKVDDSIFFGTMQYNEAYKKKVIKKEVVKLLKKGISVVFTSSTIKKSIIFPAKGRKMSEVWSTLQKRWREKNDNSLIHN